MHSGEELVAGNRKPGPQNPFSTPQNIRDGTNSLQPTPKPSTSGFWQGVESASDGVYAVLSQRLLTLANQGLSAMDLQRSLLAKYGDQAAAEAEKYFGYVTDQVKNAADWESLNKLAGPVLGQESFQAGVVVGFAESLVGDAASLLGLLKMLVLAGMYQRTQSPSTLIVDPMSAVMLLAVKCVPTFAEQTKAADEQLQKMVKELLEIARHPLDFIEAVGRNAWKGGMNDLEQLKFYAHQNTLMSQFQAGRIVGRVLYQVTMAILMVVGAAGAVAKLASKFPELLRIAGIIGKGGELGDLVEVTEAGGGAAKAVEKGPEFVKVDDFGKTKTTAPEPKPEAPPNEPPPTKTEPPPPPAAPIDYDGHVLQGEVKPNGKVVGGHSTATGQVKVIPGTEAGRNSLGVYKAKIEVPDPSNPGQFIPKSNNGGYSTMFPDDWSGDRIKAEVNAAFQNKTVSGNTWSGTTPSGVKVQGYLQPKTTVYPVL